MSGLASNFINNGEVLYFLISCGKAIFHDDYPNSDMPQTERIPAVPMES